MPLLIFITLHQTGKHKGGENVDARNTQLSPSTSLSLSLSLNLSLSLPSSSPPLPLPPLNVSIVVFRCLVLVLQTVYEPRCRNNLLLVRICCEGGGAAGARHCTATARLV